MSSADSNDFQASWGLFWYWALFNGPNGDDIQENLRFLHEQFDDRRPTSPIDQYNDEAALRLALGPPDEVSVSVFWHTILLWGWFMKTDILVPRPFADLLTRYNLEYMHGYTQLQLLARFLGITESTRHTCTSTTPRSDVEELIIAAISMGLDVHEGFPDKTPLKIMLNSFVTAWPEENRPSNEGLRKVLLKWLKILQRANVDLCGYGRVEERTGLEQRPLHLWFLSNHGIICLHISALKPLIFQFTYGPTPADWSVTLAEEDLFQEYVLLSGEPGTQNFVTTIYAYNHFLHPHL
jgi:hypothetical protein